MMAIQIRRVAQIFVAPLLLLICACAPLGLDYQRPNVALPSAYNQSDAVAASTVVSASWWTLYQDATLNDLIGQAQQNNADIKQAVARIEEVEAAAREIGAETFPSLNLDGRATRTRVTESGPFPVFGENPRNNFNAQIGTSFELDFWGKLRRAKESARAQALASHYAKATVDLSLTGMITQQYWFLRSLDAQTAIAQASLKTREASLALTRRRLEGGVASGLDLHQAEAARASLKAQLAELVKLRAQTLHQLASLSGNLELSIPALANTGLSLPPTPPVGLPSSLLEARPDVRLAEQQLISANANIGVAKAALYPSISLTAALGGESLALSDVLKASSRIWTGGLNLNLPIFDSGKRSAQVDQASAQQKQVLANYQRVIQTAFTEVNDALVAVRQNAERESALSDSQLAAKKALDIAMHRYQSGYSAYLDVLDAQRVYHAAELSFVQAREARLQATVALFKALGGGWQAAN
jgi:multidrug efflux system outer membrane protein